MLRCLTKSKIDCSFQNNEFRFKNRGFTQFFFFWFSFFFHFFGLHWMKLRNGMLKIMGGGFEKKRKKRRKKHSSYGKKKKFEKKGPDGIRTRDLRFSIIAGSNPPLIRDRRLTTWPPSHNAC